VPEVIGDTMCISEYEMPCVGERAITAWELGNERDCSAIALLAPRLANTLTLES